MAKGIILKAMVEARLKFEQLMFVHKLMGECLARTKNSVASFAQIETSMRELEVLRKEWDLAFRDFMSEHRAFIDRLREHVLANRAVSKRDLSRF